MILLKTIIDRMRDVGLDAQGADYYLDDLDMIPAVNSAIEWLVGIISQRLGKDKFVEERLSELHMVKVWQTNKFSRVSVKSTLGFKIWTITGVFAEPMVYVSLNSGTTLPPKYQVDIMPYINKQYTNAPMVSVSFDSGNLLESHESTYRPELAFVSSKWGASKLTTEQIGDYQGNPFSPGFKRKGDFRQYGWFTSVQYSNDNPLIPAEGKYLLETPQEMQIVPEVPRQLVAVSFIRVPEEIPVNTNTATYYLPLPASLLNIIVQKALNYVSIKQGDNTTIFNVSIQEVIQQLQ